MRGPGRNVGKAIVLWLLPSAAAALLGVWMFGQEGPAGRRQPRPPTRPGATTAAQPTRCRYSALAQVDRDQRRARSSPRGSIRVAGDAGQTPVQPARSSTT